jgi:hypothetical protein
MALQAVYRAVPNSVVQHPNGDQIQANAAGILTVGLADALSWNAGPVPAKLVAQGKFFYSWSSLLNNPPAVPFLYLQGSTTDRNGLTQTAGTYPPPPFGIAVYDTTLSKFVFYVGPGQPASGGVASTSFVDQNGLVV